MIRTSIILAFIVALCCSPLLCCLAFGENSWTFVVIGDTRGERETTTGVSEYLPKIASKITSLNPGLVLVNGDLINGDALSDTPDVNNPRIPYATQFANWKTAMRPVYGAGITIYPVRGNHENYASDNDPPIPSLKQAYFDAFGSTVPQNGPNNGADDNQAGFSWNLKEKNVRVVTADQYFYYHATPLGGRSYYEIDQAWVDAQLSKTAPRPYTFVMAHEPVYSLSHEEGGFYGTSAQGMADREAFWNSLGANDSKMYLTAHVHNLQVGTAVDDSGNVIYQNMMGNGGAKLNSIDGARDPLLTPTYSNDTDYGFSLFTVTDNNITETYYLYDSTSDTWTVATYTIKLLANKVCTWNTPSGIFSDASSWDPGIVPDAAYTAVFDSGAGTSSTADFTAGAYNKRLFVASGSVTFNLAGNTYTADSTAIDGSEDASYCPSLTISGAGSHFNTTSLTMDGVSSFIVNTGAFATCDKITIEGGTATIIGDITVNNFNLTAGTLDLGANTLTLGAAGAGNYTQAAGTTLKTTIQSTAVAGNINASGAASGICAVTGASKLSITVDPVYIPSNTTWTILDGAAGTKGIAVLPTITSNSRVLTFTAAAANGGDDLTVTATRIANVYADDASGNSNAAAAGAILDSIAAHGATGDMGTVLGALDALPSAAAVDQALQTVLPTVDSGTTTAATNALSQFIGTATDRLEGLYAQAHNEETGETGVSTGSEGRKGFEAWGRGFGEYAHQDPRGTSNGYHATIWGTALGGDTPAFSNRVRLGVSGGYAASDVNSKDNSGASDISSYQSAFYGGYMDPEKPYYINGAFSFAYNTYKGRRNISAGAIQRMANSSYRGQQYSVLFDGGYTFKTKQVNITPIASLQYLHLHIQSYTETGADALNLTVKSQDYDLLETGLGAKFDHSFEVSYGTIIPEIHVKWLYDAITDKQATTSTFSGGGGSFATDGFTPARNALNVGGRLALVTKGNWSFDANYDFEYKQDYTSHTGWADIRYSF